MSFEESLYYQKNPKNKQTKKPKKTPTKQNKTNLNAIEIFRD